MYKKDDDLSLSLSLSLSEFVMKKVVSLHSVKFPQRYYALVSKKMY